MAWLFSAEWLCLRASAPASPRLHRPPRRADQLGLPFPAPIQLPLPEIGRPLLLVKVVGAGKRRRVLPLQGEQLFVQFPRALRTLGAVFVVEDLVQMARPGQVPFLRAVGPFRLLRVEHVPGPARRGKEDARAQAAG